jgi:hypothetical protein
MIGLSLLLLWLITGYLALRWWGRPVGREAVRSVSSRIVARGGRVRVTVTLTPPVDELAIPEREIVLLLDRSASMGAAPGSPLQEMLRAATLFVQRTPRHLRLGAIAFDHGTEELARLGEDHAAVLRSLSGVRPGGGTAIAAALDAAATMLARSNTVLPKTIVLCTDGGDDIELTRAAAARLKDQFSEIQIIAVGFGTGIDVQVLNAIASEPKLAITAQGAGDLQDLFTLLADQISGGRAVAGIVRESINARGPFLIVGYDGIRPVIQTDSEPVATTWAFPAASAEPVIFHYDLETRCSGWHAVVTEPAAIRWRLPGGAVTTAEIAVGPRILVLHPWLKFLGVLMHPFMMRWLRRNHHCPPDSPVEPPLLPRSEHDFRLPDLPKPPVPDPRQPEPVPVLLITVGAQGADVIAALQASEPQLAGWHILHVQVGGEPDRNLSDTITKVTISADIDRWLGNPETDVHQSDWLPLARWRRTTRPLNTAHGHADDRVLARLALLQDPSSVEQEISRLISQLPDAASILIAGAAADADYSGLALELAHIVAGRGRSASLVMIVPEPPAENVGQLAAFASEIRRLLQLKDQPAVSTRGGGLVTASRLLEQVLCLTASDVPSDDSARLAALCWQLARRPDAAAYLQGRSHANAGHANAGHANAGHAIAGQANAGQVEIDSRRIAAAGLWHAAQTWGLASLVINGWIGAEEGRRPEPDGRADLVENFWSGNAVARPPTALVIRSGRVRAGETLLVLADAMPEQLAAAPYFEQAAYAAADLLSFVRYVEDWAYAVLTPGDGAKKWQLTNLIQALDALDVELQQVEASASGGLGDPYYANFMEFAAVQLREYQKVLSQIRSSAEQWHRDLVGEPRLTGPLDGLAGQLRRNADDGLMRLQLKGRRAAVQLKQRLESWTPELVSEQISQLRLYPDIDGRTGRLTLVMRTRAGEHSTAEQFAKALPGLVQRHRSTVLTWPESAWFDTGSRGDEPVDLRIGAHAAAMFGGTGPVVDAWDRLDATGISVTWVTADLALSCSGHRADPEYFAWPEEANAERLNSALRKQLGYVPSPFPPQIIVLLQDPVRLCGWFQAIADGQLFESGTAIVAETATGGRARLLDLVEVPADLRLTALLDKWRKASAEVQRIGEGRGAPDPQTLLDTIEQVPWLEPVRGSADWGQWRNVILGVACMVRDQSQ